MSAANVMGRRIEHVLLSDEAWHVAAPDGLVLAVWDGDEIIGFAFGRDERQTLARARLFAVGPELAELAAAITRVDSVTAAHGLAPHIKAARAIWNEIAPPAPSPVPEARAPEAVHTNDCAVWDGGGRCNCEEVR